MLRHHLHCLCLSDETVYKPLVVGIMHMAVEHIGQRPPVLIPPAIIPDLRIVLDPAEPAIIKFLVLQKPIVISRNQI